MKKSLVALAVVAAVPAFAQAQTSIQLTGSVDVAVESLNKHASSSGKKNSIIKGINQLSEHSEHYFYNKYVDIKQFEYFQMDMIHLNNNGYTKYQISIQQLTTMNRN